MRYRVWALVIALLALAAPLWFQAQAPPTVDLVSQPAKLVADNPSSASPISFTYQLIPFRLESSETPERHAPETMAGGVAVFDYNNDGRLDIFFTNGADIKTLQVVSEILQSAFRK